jgi:hypothetical protein
LLCCADKASDEHSFSESRLNDRSRWNGEWDVNTLTGFGGEPEQCVCLPARRQGAHAGREIS